MKLDFTQTLKNLDGNPFTDEKGQPLTLKSAIITICSVPLESDKDMNTVEKFKIGEIAMTVFRDLDLATDQVALVKERGAKVFNSPILVYLLHTALEGVN